MGRRKSETVSIDDFDEFCCERKPRNTIDVERYEALGSLRFFFFLFNRREIICWFCADETNPVEKKFEWHQNKPQF